MNIGSLGETAAANYLQAQNYSILIRNYRTRFGEIDIVAQKGNTIIFVEVKSRIGDIKGKPYESVNFIKINHLKKAIYHYLAVNKLHDHPLRIDVLSLIYNPDKSLKELKHFEDVSQ